jgi:trigger factor
LRESLEKQFQEKAERETKNNINDAIAEALLAQSTVELPETLIQEEVTNLLTQTLVQMQQMGVDVKKLFTSETVPRMRENARPEALENLKRSLIIAEIAKRESLQPTEAEIVAKMQEVEQQLSGQDLDRDKLRKMVTEDLQTEKTFDWLRTKIQVELVPPGSLTEEEAEPTEEEEVTETIDATVTNE